MKQAQPVPAGSFNDLQRLFDQLAKASDLAPLLSQLEKPPLLLLATPIPADKYLPRKKIGRCPAAHNRALIDRRF